jgi:hypothetical protein
VIWEERSGLLRYGCRFAYHRGFPELLIWDRSISAGVTELLEQVPTIRRLQVRGSIGPRGARDLADRPQLGRLTSLNLHHTGIGDKGARALAGSAYLSGLAELVLSDNWMTDRGARAIAASQSLAGVGCLDLRDNLIGKTTIHLLRKRFGDRVKC